MTLALFDLDNTLLAGDSDHLWGEFLVEVGAVDAAWFARENDRHYQAYQQGSLDIEEYLAFALRPLAEHDTGQLLDWRREFIRRKVQPIVLEPARALVASHRRRGDTCVIITATNQFVTEPIAGLFGIEHLLATVPEQRDGRFTGGFEGRPTFREGKIAALEDWAAVHRVDPWDAWFYSDSHNDLPLLERVREPVAVDPDPQLRERAEARGWRVMSLRGGGEP